MWQDQTITPMIPKVLLTEWQIASTELLQVLSCFDQEQLNTVPGEGNWSAGQVADHLIKASMVKVLHGPVKPTQRPADQYVQPLREQFLDFTTRMTSPQFLLPAQTVYRRETLLHQLSTLSAEMEEAIQMLDLSATCLGAPRELGELTRWEAVNFNIFHIRRHTHQLKQIYPKVIKAGV